MYLNKKVLAIIPARGGSKGLPNKNIRALFGKPLINWSIDQVSESLYVDKLIVSTDDDEIAKVCTENNADVPFIRPKKLASDTATSTDVIFHAIDFLERNGEKYDIIVLIEPTSPLRETKDIDLAIETLVNHPNARSIAGISEVEDQHPDFLVEITNGLMSPYNDFDVKRRQDVSKLYFFEGTVYASFIDTFYEEKSFYHKKSIGYIVPKWKSFEIDDLVDFLVVEKMLESKIKGLL